MATVRKLPNSKYWIACFTAADGRQRQRSTRILGTEKLRPAAQKIAETFESAYRDRQSEAQILQVFTDVSRDLHSRALKIHTLRSWRDEWLELRRGELSRGTYQKYFEVGRDLERYLPDRLDAKLHEITEKDVRRFYGAVGAVLSSGTARNKLKILRILFSDAVKRGVIKASPAVLVKVRAKSEADTGSGRRRFTDEELSKLLAVATGEWRTLILAGLYTGQRLGDLAAMRWRQIDLTTDSIKLKSIKTGRFVRIPIAAPLRRILAPLHQREPSGPVFPHANEVFLKDEQVRRLSAEFRKILVEAGLAKPYTHKATGRGRSVRRGTSELSFHSLRHTTNSLLHDAGIRTDVVMDIIGHDSVATSQLYTHVSHEAKLNALRQLPDFTGGNTPAPEAQEQSKPQPNKP